MPKPKLVRITTIPLSLEKLLEGQLGYMASHFDVTAVSAEEQRLREYAEKEGVHYFHVALTRKITPFKDIRAVYKLYRFLQNEKPDIVHTHTPKAGIVGMMAAYLARVPNRIHDVAGLPLMEATGLKRNVLIQVEKLTYFFATHVLPNSKGLQDYILQHRFTTKKKMNILGEGSSNGTNTDYFRDECVEKTEVTKTKEAWKIPKDDFIFVFIRRLVGDKGINELVVAFKALAETKSNCTLLLVGPVEDTLDPLEKHTLVEISKNPKIVTTGFQQDVRNFLALSDALVFPSYREGFPNVVMEAGAMGLPSIVTDINGCNEIIEHGKNGYIVPKKNSIALMDAMLFFLENPVEVAKMQQNARPMIVNRYKREHIWQLILAEYQSILQNT